ncbi:Zonadhesin [Holothuria leucospilota]|uniref:Zonadhesin n=1 Tax=Holothuria leucospilota TaxID=206669 RepID=A0A9Q1BVE9_HOLLE|nr:Zonadhesin [Holothuria leucospilota]
MKFGICTCQATCDEPNIRNRCGKNCINGEGCSCSDGFLFKGDDCVPEAECGCFLQGRGVVKNGDTYVNEDCSSRCTCINDVLTCEYYHCSQHAYCEVRNNVRMCYCDNHFVGNGQTCTSTRGDCLDLYNAGNRNSGVYNIFPTGWSDTSFPVYCDMTTEGRGWTVRF